MSSKYFIKNAEKEFISLKETVKYWREAKIKEKKNDSLVLGNREDIYEEIFNTFHDNDLKIIEEILFLSGISVNNLNIFRKTLLKECVKSKILGNNEVFLQVTARVLNDLCQETKDIIHLVKQLELYYNQTIKELNLNFAASSIKSLEELPLLLAKILKVYDLEFNINSND